MLFEEIQGLIAAIREEDERYRGAGAGAGYSTQGADALKGQAFDVAALASRGRRYEELDQLVMELLLGAR